MNKRRQKSGIHIGSSSILMVFVTLCLVSFATLSYVSALADWKLVSRTADRSLAYYAASNQAQENLSSLDAALRKAYANTSSAEEYFSLVGHRKSFSTAISEVQALNVTVEILFPDEAPSPFYRIQTWQVQNIREPDYNTTLPVPLQAITLPCIQ